MKKFFTILAVAILTIGCVFATTTEGAGTASLKLVTSITEVEPTFQIKADSGNIVTSGAAGVGESDVEVRVDHDLSEANADDATVNFVLYQISDAKMFGGYTITVSATDLVAVKPSEVTDADWNAISAGNKMFSVDSTSPAITKHADYSSNSVGFARFTDGSASNVMGVTYLGVLKASSTAPVEVGTFTCVWGANDKAIVGDYEATITLTVASV